RQSNISLKERKHWSPTCCYTHSYPVEHLVLTNLDVQLAVGVVKRLLKQSVKTTINSDIPLLGKPLLWGDISQSLDSRSWYAPEIKQLNLGQLLITVLTTCLSLTVGVLLRMACSPLSATTSSSWTRAGLRCGLSCLSTS